MKNTLVIMLFVIVAATQAQAQTVTTTVDVPPVMTTVNVPPIATTIEAPMPVKAPTTVTAAKMNAEIIAASSTKVVKDAPFSAEGISESVQTLADGNRISRSSTVKMFRDGDGRFRREGGGGTGNGYGYATTGSTVTVYGMQDMISIFDPVEGVRYVLNPTDRTARRFETKNMLTEGAVYINGTTLSPSVRVPVPTTDAAKKAVEAAAAYKANVVVMPSLVTGTMSGGKTEQLGSKSFEGVSAEGTRTVTTIAAGVIGNERPIEIIYEKWYSKELDLIVYSRHYDPRFGEQTYRLVNINRSEPDRSLFTVPSDYKTVAEPTRVYTTRTPVPTTPTKPQ